MYVILIGCFIVCIVKCDTFIQTTLKKILISITSLPVELNPHIASALHQCIQGTNFEINMHVFWESNPLPVLLCHLRYRNTLSAITILVPIDFAQCTEAFPPSAFRTEQTLVFLLGCYCIFKVIYVPLEEGLCSKHSLPPAMFVQTTSPISSLYQ